MTENYFQVNWIEAQAQAQETYDFFSSIEVYDTRDEIDGGLDVGGPLSRPPKLAPERCNDPLLDDGVGLVGSGCTS